MKKMLALVTLFVLLFFLIYMRFHLYLHRIINYIMGQAHLVTKNTTTVTTQPALVDLSLCSFSACYLKLIQCGTYHKYIFCFKLMQHVRCFPHNLREKCRLSVFDMFPTESVLLHMNKSLHLGITLTCFTFYKKIIRL